jgi:hypothetical protein
MYYLASAVTAWSCAVSLVPLVWCVAPCCVVVVVAARKDTVRVLEHAAAAAGMLASCCVKVLVAARMQSVS